jgi:valyl-tRNA synthetase
LAFLAIASVIDKDAELARLSKEIGKIEGELAKIAGKLGNEKFVANAPEAVVAKERDRQAQLESQLVKLKDQHAVIEAL